MVIFVYSANVCGTCERCLLRRNTRVKASLPAQKCWEPKVTERVKLISTEELSIYYIFSSNYKALMHDIWRSFKSCFIRHENDEEFWLNLLCLAWNVVTLDLCTREHFLANHRSLIVDYKQDQSDIVLDNEYQTRTGKIDYSS